MPWLPTFRIEGTGTFPLAVHRHRIGWFLCLVGPGLDALLGCMITSLWRVRCPSQDTVLLPVPLSPADIATTIFQSVSLIPKLCPSYCALAVVPTSFALPREQLWDSPLTPHSPLSSYVHVTKGRALGELTFITPVCTHLIYVYLPHDLPPPLCRRQPEAPQ